MKRASKLRVVANIDIGITQGRVGEDPSTKYALRRLNDQTVLGRMVQRLIDCTQINQIVISGAGNPSSVCTFNISQVEIFDCRLPHLCERLGAVADRYNADWVLVVSANRPFLDPALTDCLVSNARKCGDCDYVGFVSKEDHVRRIAQLGLTGEMIHADCLRRLRRSVHRLEWTQDRSMSVADWLVAGPGVYQMRLIPITADLDRPDLRFAVENDRDWETAMSLGEAVRDTDWQTLRDLVDNNIQLRNLMLQSNEQESNSAVAPA
jgi:spore coat polysaccharide biosynthesis protein SpsF (cytidylyltransferase family)